MPSTKNGEWPHYTADVRGQQVLAARSDQRRQLQQARSRLALQDRQPRPASRVQARRHAADGQGRALHDRRHAPRRSSRSTPKTGELIWVAQPARRAARAAIAPRQLSGRGVSYWTDGKGDERILYVTTGYRLVALNAQDRPADPVLRQGRHRRSEGRRGRSATDSRSISRPAKSACTRRRPSSRTS